MDNLHTINGKPVESGSEMTSLPTVRLTSSAAAPAAVTKPKQKHAAACGNVGNTGEHGDLGSNAAKE